MTKTVLRQNKYGWLEDNFLTQVLFTQHLVFTVLY